MFKYCNNLSLRAELSKNLAQLHVQYAAEVEFYLPQLVYVYYNLNMNNNNRTKFYLLFCETDKY